MSFLTAEWRKLAIINYEVPPLLLKQFLPAGTELDIWNNKCYISLVAFLFQNTKVLGIPVPFHTNFEEVNLRFYVKRNENGEWKRGVVFIKELVPKTLIAFFANAIYHENYQKVPMSHSISSNKNRISLNYYWEIEGYQNKFEIVADNNCLDIKSNTEIEFITEHYWGYTKVNRDKSYEYEVTHPKWNHYNIISYDIDINYKKTYGDKFEELDLLKPTSVMLAEGSIISVKSKKTITN